MVSTRIQLHDEMLFSTFKRFDTDNSGYITVSNLREVLGNTFEQTEVEKLLAEADLLKDGRISYPEFQAFLKGESLTPDQADKIIDTQLDKAAKPREDGRPCLKMPKRT